MKQVERPCGRSHNGHVSEFTESNYFREPQKAGEWSLRLWRGTVMVSSGHCFREFAGADPSGDAPENQSWDRKPLTEMNGEPWNTPPRQEEKLQIQDRECIALEQQIKCGGQKVCMACSRHAGANPWDLRTRSQNNVDDEVAQDRQRKFERLTRKNTVQFEQWQHAKLKQ